MIVKTGANYQAEGGYIEASRVGDTVTVRTENKTLTIPSTNGVVDTRVLCKMKTSENVQSGGTYYGVSTGEPFHMGGYSLPSYPNEINVSILFNIGTTISMPGGRTAILLDGSQDCELRQGQTSSGQYLYATGPNPVAILGVQ